LVLVVDKAGNELVAQNADEPFIPASVTKIVTAWLAMEGGDPFLISEELELLAPRLLAAEPFTGVVLESRSA
jgi:D-alanyl-D-alanine carboxypeptidase/D-alanyl-D-alanine-endopeptidase (penicillin-binding protein 4)